LLRSTKPQRVEKGRRRVRLFAHPTRCRNTLRRRSGRLCRCRAADEHDRLFRLDIEPRAACWCACGPELGRSLVVDRAIMREPGICHAKPATHDTPPAPMTAQIQKATLPQEPASPLPTRTHLCISAGAALLPPFGG
jgi:hypothetical protein